MFLLPMGRPAEDAETLDLDHFAAFCACAISAKTEIWPVWTFCPLSDNLEVVLSSPQFLYQRILKLALPSPQPSHCSRNIVIGCLLFLSFSHF